MYEFTGEAGDLLNFELISDAPNRIVDSFDTEISILDANGNFVDYFGEDAINDDEFEIFDSIIIDLVLPESGTFFVQINSSPFAPSDTGDYELFISRFNGIVVAVPEASSVAAIIMLGCLMTTRRRKK